MNKKLCFALIFSGLVSGALSSQTSADTFVYSGGCFWCTEADVLPGMWCRECVLVGLSGCGEHRHPD